MLHHLVWLHERGPRFTARFLLPLTLHVRSEDSPEGADVDAIKDIIVPHAQILLESPRTSDVVFTAGFLAWLLSSSPDSWV